MDEETAPGQREVLAEVLHRFLVIEGVIGALLTRKDGQTIGSAIAGPFNEAALAAVTAFVMAESRAVAACLGRRELSMVFAEFTGSILLSFPVGSDAYLVIIARHPANIVKVQQTFRSISDTLRESA